MNLLSSPVFFLEQKALVKRAVAQVQCGLWSCIEMVHCKSLCQSFAEFDACFALLRRLLLESIHVCMECPKSCCDIAATQNRNRTRRHDPDKHSSRPSIPPRLDQSKRLQFLGADGNKLTISLFGSALSSPPNSMFENADNTRNTKGKQSEGIIQYIMRHDQNWEVQVLAPLPD